MKLLEEGDVIILKIGHVVYADIPEHFVFSNRKGIWTLTHINVTIVGEFKYLLGKYIVIKTAFDGGGTGMGHHDTYPNGHHVWAEQVPERKEDICHKVDFYQTGAFTAMITDIEPIGKAERTWKIK